MVEFVRPRKSELTLYSKSGCPNCHKIKKYLNDNFLAFTVVDCDEYLIEHRTEFLQFINTLAKKEVNTFPMIFDYEHFVGGYKEAIEYAKTLQENILDFDMSF